MTLIKTAALAIATSLATSIAIAGHHEKGEHINLAAQPGQIMVVYHWPCADTDAGLTLIKEDDRLRTRRIALPLFCSTRCA